MVGYTYTVSEIKAGQPLKITLGPETETGRGWRYAVTIHWPEGETTEHAVTLSHHDYEHWCGGIEPPSRLAERGVRIAAEAFGTELPSRFDLSQMRRRIPGASGFEERMNCGD
jgi:hypothetical protein